MKDPNSSICICQVIEPWNLYLVCEKYNVTLDYNDIYRGQIGPECYFNNIVLTCLTSGLPEKRKHPMLSERFHSAQSVRFSDDMGTIILFNTGKVSMPGFSRLERGPISCQRLLNIYRNEGYTHFNMYNIFPTNTVVKCRSFVKPSLQQFKIAYPKLTDKPKDIKAVYYKIFKSKKVALFRTGIFNTLGFSSVELYWEHREKFITVLLEFLRTEWGNNCIPWFSELGKNSKTTKRSNARPNMRAITNAAHKRKRLQKNYKKTFIDDDNDDD